MGRRLSVAGLVLSVVFAGFYTFTGFSVAYSAAWDDGYVRRDSTSPQWADALPNNVDGVGYDTRDYLQELQVAEPQASRGDVRADIERVEGDLDALNELSASAAVHRDWTATGVMGELQQLLADSASMTSLCSNYMDFV